MDNNKQRLNLIQAKYLRTVKDCVGQNQIRNDRLRKEQGIYEAEGKMGMQIQSFPHNTKFENIGRA